MSKQSAAGSHWRKININGRSYKTTYGNWCKHLYRTYVDREWLLCRMAELSGFFG